MTDYRNYLSVISHWDLHNIQYPYEYSKLQLYSIMSALCNTSMFGPTPLSPRSRVSHLGPILSAETSCSLTNGSLKYLYHDFTLSGNWTRHLCHLIIVLTSNWHVATGGIWCSRGEDKYTSCYNVHAIKYISCLNEIYKTCSGYNHRKMNPSDSFHWKLIFNLHTAICFTEWEGKGA